MPDRIENFHIVSAAGGSPANMTLERITVDSGVPVAVTLHVPSGHMGKTGIQIAYNTQQLIPNPPRVYYRGNKRTIRRELSDVYPTGGAFWVQHFNEGRYPHAFDVEIELDALDLTAGVLPPVLLIYGGVGTVAPTPAPVPAPSGDGGIVPV